MNKAILEHNGVMARAWAINITEKMSLHTRSNNHSKDAQQAIDHFCDSCAPQAEIRRVIHQSIGVIDYFVIPMLNESYSYAYLRGYLTPNAKVTDLIKCSSDEFKALEYDGELLALISETLPEFLGKMAPSFPGKKSLKSHYDTEDGMKTLGDQVNENDWAIMQQIVLSTSKSDSLSPEFLDLFDLHSAPQPINQ